MDNLPNFHLGNLILFLSVVAWAVAQILKVVVVLVQKHRLDFRNILSRRSILSWSLLLSNLLDLRRLLFDRLFGGCGGGGECDAAGDDERGSGGCQQF